MTRTVKNPFLKYYLKELCHNCQQKFGGVQFYEDKKAKCYIYTRVSTAIQVEDGIDRSKETGKLLISILAAVVEMECENIWVLIMAGREQRLLSVQKNAYTQHKILTDR